MKFDFLHIEPVKVGVLAVLGNAAALISSYLGGYTADMKLLVRLMIVDFIMGVLIATFWKKSNKSKNGTLSSISMWQGIVKKGVTILIIVVCKSLDDMMGSDYIRTAAIYAFCANELLSLVENVGVMGVPLPSVMRKVLEVLQSKEDGQK